MTTNTHIAARMSNAQRARVGFGPTLRLALALLALTALLIVAWRLPPATNLGLGCLSLAACLIWRWRPRPAQLARIAVVAAYIAGACLPAPLSLPLVPATPAAHAASSFSPTSQARPIPTRAAGWW